MEMMKYILEVIVCSGLFLVAYRWLLAKKVSFSLCRAFIMASMLLAVVIPAMNVPLFPEKTFVQQTVLTGFDLFEEELGSTMAVDSADEMQASDHVAIETVPASRTFDIKAAAGTAVKVIYLLVALASLGLTVYNVIKIQKLRRRSKLTHTEEYTLAEHEDIKTPFSFLMTIFMGYNYEPQERIQILTHEASHIRHRHSFERISLSILRSVFWFNPFFWMAETDLKEVQEWEADKDVLSEGYELKTYRTTIFKQLFGYNPDISCGLNHSLTKQRFIMMTQSHRGKGAWIRLAATLPVIAAVFLAFGCVSRPPVENAELKADANLTGSDDIRLSMPCNPTSIKGGKGSLVFELNDGDPIWAAADGRLVSVDLGDETIVTFNEDDNTMSISQPKNVNISSGNSKQAAKFKFGDLEIDLDVDGKGICRFECGPNSPGLTLKLRHEDGIETVYSNIPFIQVDPGKIKAGQLIGKAGKSASSKVVQFNFEILVNGKAVDPMPLITSPENPSKAIFIEISQTDENQNRLSDTYSLKIDGQVHLKDEVREIIVEKITNDSTIKLVQISADPQTPMGVIEDIKAQLQSIPDIRLFYVLKDIANTPPSAADETEDDYGRITYQYPRNNIIVIKTNANDRYLIGSEPGYLTEETAARVKGYILNKENDPKLPSKIQKEFTLPDGTTFNYPVSQAVILTQNDRGTSFKGYQEINQFIREIYFDIRNDLALELFGRSLGNLSDAEMAVLVAAVPMNVVEATPKNAPKVSE